MSYKYEVEIEEFKEVHEMPNAWTQADLLNLLDHLEYEDAHSIPPEELKEMTALALSDFEPEEAAVKVLEFRLGDRLNKGQRQNIAEDLKEEKLWEEYADISFHEELFHIGCMLHWAFPREFPEPDIIRVGLNIKALTPQSSSNLMTPTASFITRILNDGMNEHNTIFRLFDDKIASNSFPEANDIIWEFKAHEFSKEDSTQTFTIYTSFNWVDELKGIQKYESTAYSDGQLH